MRRLSRALEAGDTRVAKGGASALSERNPWNEAADAQDPELSKGDAAWPKTCAKTRSQTSTKAP